MWFYFKTCLVTGLTTFFGVFYSNQRYNIIAIYKCIIHLQNTLIINRISKKQIQTIQIRNISVKTKYTQEKYITLQSTQENIKAELMYMDKDDDDLRNEVRTSKKYGSMHKTHKKQNISINNSYLQTQQLSTGKPGTYNKRHQLIKQNGRLIKRIINPKRDKLIIRSLEQVRSYRSTNDKNRSMYSRKNRIRVRENDGCKYPNPRDDAVNYCQEWGQCAGDEFCVKNDRARTQHCNRSKKNQINRNSLSSNSIAPLKYQQLYQLQLQNYRMGKRILNTKSTVRNLMQFSGSNKNNSKGHGNGFLLGRNQYQDIMCGGHQVKINDGVFTFFRPNFSRHSHQRPGCFAKQQSYQTSVSNNRSTNNKQNENYAVKQLKKYYGQGPTILSITSLQLQTNPCPKNQDLIMLQLKINQTAQNSHINPKLMNKQFPLGSACEQKRSKTSYMTDLIPYQVLRQGRAKVKFAIRIRDIGEYVPLKIWKVCGVNHIQMGIIDIQFSKYLLHQQQLQQSPPTSPHSHQYYQTNQSGKLRTLISDRVETKLRKEKVEESHGLVSVQYSIYRKRYG